MLHNTMLTYSTCMHVYAGCEAGQYSTITCTHTHLNLRAILELKPKPMKAGFYPTNCGYFLRLLIGPRSNWDPY